MVYTRMRTTPVMTEVQKEAAEEQWLMSERIIQENRGQMQKSQAPMERAAHVEVNLNTHGEIDIDAMLAFPDVAAYLTELGGHAELPAVELDADTFGMSVCSLTRDSYFADKEGRWSSARILRVVTTLCLVVLTITIQVWLLVKVKEFVCARSVHDIRNDYDKFELAIYGEENCTLTARGNSTHNHHRGIIERMPSVDVMQARLNGMSDDDKDRVCRIPLSQPYFFGMILLIWTLSCVSELRKACHLQMVITMLPSVTSMQEAVELEAPSAGDPIDPNALIVKGITDLHRGLLTVFTFMPRVGVCLYLLYVGCRWLLATNSFSDLILNAMALEFILGIKEILYSSLMPARNQHDLSLTKVTPYPTHLGSAWHDFVNTMSLLLVSMLWVFLYMHKFQGVLPGFNWDVHDVCKEYILERYSV